MCSSAEDTSCSSDEDGAGVSESQDVVCAAVASEDDRPDEVRVDATLEKTQVAPEAKTIPTVVLSPSWGPGGGEGVEDGVEPASEDNASCEEDVKEEAVVDEEGVFSTFIRACSLDNGDELSDSAIINR